MRREGKLREAWLEPGEMRGWACDRCGRTGYGMPDERCPRCGDRELYRLAIRPCPAGDTAACRNPGHQVIDGRPSHFRVG